MNVLILTPDAVGSTLLQRLITIYMHFHNFDRPVINLHELTNGLVRYHNQALGQEVLGKKEGAWGYYQTLQQVVELLSSVDHYKTSRLAHYHIKNRQDSMADQVPFYQYLNDNFYIISCRRHNLFEHALSMTLSKITKKLNVYDDKEKINSFFEYYKNGVDLDPNSLIQTLNAYKEYLSWCDNHFNVASYFYYEEHLPIIEKYILNLPIFSQQPLQLTWKDNFNMEFDQWNMCRYITSDLGALALGQPETFARLASTATVKQIDYAQEQFLHSYRKIAKPDWPAISSIEQYQQLPQDIKDSVEKLHNISLPTSNNLISRVDFERPFTELLPTEHQNYINHHKARFDQSMNYIRTMIGNRLLISAPPIKKQILSEKKYMVRNYQHLLDVYNQWIEQNPDLGRPLDNDILNKFAEMEQARWNPATSALAVSDQPSAD